MEVSQFLPMLAAHLRAPKQESALRSDGASCAIRRVSHDNANLTASSSRARLLVARVICSNPPYSDGDPSCKRQFGAESCDVRKRAHCRSVRELRDALSGG